MKIETRKRFLNNLWECIAWAACAVFAVVVAYAVLMLSAFVGGSPSPQLPFTEILRYALLGAWRLVFYSLCVASPFLACAAFKTWVLKK